jgi:phage terminase large subunit-like protein
MEWQVSNVVGAADRKDNVYPNKPDGQAHLKIDNTVALMSALGVVMNAEEEFMPASPWDDPNFSMAGAE